MPSLARVQSSGIPMVVYPVLAGGNGEGSPLLQHERIIPQWKTAESPTKEKVRHKISHFQSRSQQAHSGRCGATFSTFLEAQESSGSSVSGLLYPLCALVLKIPDGIFLHHVTNF